MSLRYDASSEYNVHTSPGDSFDTACVIWFKPIAAGNGSYDSVWSLSSVTGGAAGQGMILQQGGASGTADHLSFWHHNGTSWTEAQFTSSPVFNAGNWGKWWCAAFVHDISAGTIDCYLRSEDDTTWTYTAGLTSRTANANFDGGEMRLGTSTFEPEWFNGEIGNVKVWGTAAGGSNTDLSYLTAGALLAESFTRQPIHHKGLWLWSPLDDGEVAAPEAYAGAQTNTVWGSGFGTPTDPTVGASGPPVFDEIIARNFGPANEPYVVGVYDDGFQDSTTPTSVAGIEWKTGDRIVVFAGVADGNATLSSAPTNGNLTFSQRQLANSGTLECEIGIWTADAGSDQTGQTISLAFTQFSPVPAGMKVLVVRNAGDYVSSGFNRTESAFSLTPPDGGIVLWCGLDWNATNVPGRGLTQGQGLPTRTHGQFYSGDWTVWTGHWAPTDGSTDNFGLESYTSLKITQGWVSFGPAGGGAQNINATGLAAGVTFGTAAVDSTYDINPTGLAAGASFGTLLVNFANLMEGFRWRNDDGTETTATWAANQDTNITAGLVTRRLRILTDHNEDPPSQAMKLQYRPVGSTDWIDVPLP